MKEAFPAFEHENNSSKERRGRFWERARKTVLATMIGLASMPAQSRAEGTFLGEEDYKSPISAVIRDFEIAQGERKVTSEKEIREMLYTDDHERIFLGSDNALKEYSGRHGQSGYIRFADVQEIIDSGEKSPVVAHTHPISVYSLLGYSQEQLSKIQKEHLPIAPNPPSSQDFFMSIQFDEQFDEEGVEIRNRVYEPSGVWEFVVKDAEVVERVQKANGELLERLTKVFEKWKGKIPFEIGSVHPQRIIQELRANPETVKIAEEIEKAGQEFAEDQSPQVIEALEALVALEGIGEDIATATRLKKENDFVTKKIEEYKEGAAKIGVVVTYEPYPLGSP